MAPALSLGSVPSSVRCLAVGSRRSSGLAASTSAPSTRLQPLQPRRVAVACSAAGAGGRKGPKEEEDRLASNDRAVFGRRRGQFIELRIAREAAEACRSVPFSDPEQRDLCYADYGVDGDRVEEYLEIVESLEAALPTGPDYQALLHTVAQGTKDTAFGLTGLVLVLLGRAVMATVYGGRALATTVAHKAAEAISLPGAAPAAAAEEEEEEEEESQAEVQWVFDAELREFKQYNGNTVNFSNNVRHLSSAAAAHSSAAAPPGNEDACDEDQCFVFDAQKRKFRPSRPFPL